MELTTSDDEGVLLFLTDGQLMRERYHEFHNQTCFHHDLSLFRYKRDLDYILGGSIHHCERLAEMYGQVCGTFVDGPMPEQQCGKPACRDLCGGCWVTGSRTAMADQIGPLIIRISHPKRR